MAAASSSALDPSSARIPQPVSLGPLTITELPRLDIDSYIANYSGRTRSSRLITIGKTCLPLQIEALKAAVVEAKNGYDVGLYDEAVRLLQRVARNEPEAQRDEKWIAATEHANKQETQRLESELRGYKNNLIKESIRMGNEDLGNHLEKIGKLAEATEAYTKMRPDAGTTKHILECGMYLANVALQRHDWTAVISNIGKIAHLPTPEEDNPSLTYAKIITGIAFLRLELYYDAAKNFLQTDPAAPPAAYNHIASQSDVAIYGGLLALATMDRQDLQTRVLDNATFRAFMELEPILRKAIAHFVNGRYASCLEILETVRPDYSLDLHLQPHIETIFNKIRAKCIVQYFIPFSCVTLENLNATFCKPGQSIVPELVGMIRDGLLRARIDAKGRLLVKVQPDPRLAMQTNVLNVARKYEADAKDRLRRMNIVAAGLEVSGGIKGGSAGGAKEREEGWVDERRSAGPQAEDDESQAIS